MSNLRTSITTLRAALDKMPRDSNSRPMHEALIACFEAVAADGEALKMAVSLLAMDADVDAAAERGRQQHRSQVDGDGSYQTPKRQKAVNG